MIDHTTSAGLLAASDSRARLVLEDLGIDYCSSQRQALSEAAADEGIDLQNLMAALGHAMSEGTDAQPNWLDMPLSALVSHLRQEHHQILLTSLGHAAMLFELVTDPELPRQAAFGTLRSTFHQLIPLLIDHVAHEERAVFPIIEAMESAWLHGTHAPPRFEGGLGAVIGDLEKEHDSIVNALKLLRESRLALGLRRGDAEGAKLAEEVRRCESRLHHCINLENFVLFPRAVVLESDLDQQRKSA